MKYICLGYIDEDKWNAASENERNALMDACFAYDDQLRKNGHFAGGEALQSARNAITLRWQGGRVSATDGPFAETKEQLGGILALDARDMNHAIQLISEHPGVKAGPFEIRPAADLSAMIAQSQRRRSISGEGGPAEGRSADKDQLTGVTLRAFTPCLWFDGQAQEAAEFYTSIFKNSKISGITHYGKAGAEASGQPEGTVMTVAFRLDGQDFLALNGGPMFKFSPAISFIANCATQREVDELWERLSQGGEKGQCGWLTDRFGVSWQIVPTVLSEMLLEKDGEKFERVMEALMRMGKIDIETLRRAYE